MDLTTLTAALKPLQRRGLIRVTVDPNDRRGRLLRLTRRGRWLLAAAVPVWKDHHRRLERMLPQAAEKLRNSLTLLSRSTIR